MGRRRITITVGAIGAGGQQGVDGLRRAALAFRFRVGWGARAKPVALAVMANGLTLSAT